MNSNNQKILINNEGESNSPVFINILLIGNTGAWKSKLINLILEGGNGFSTTSKNILVYKKANLALRFYDVKGLEDENKLKNYVKIIKTLIVIPINLFIV
jgi:predicted GTPase